MDTVWAERAATGDERARFTTAIDEAEAEGRRAARLARGVGAALLVTGLVLAGLFVRLGGEEGAAAAVGGLVALGTPAGLAAAQGSRVAHQSRRRARDARSSLGRGRVCAGVLTSDLLRVGPGGTWRDGTLDGHGGGSLFVRVDVPLPACTTVGWTALPDGSVVLVEGSGPPVPIGPFTEQPAPSASLVWHPAGSVRGFVVARTDALVTSK